MNRILFIVILLWISLFAQSQAWKEHGPLCVVPQNPHYIQHKDGSTFLWFGDTGWEMVHRLNREEVEVYLENRRTLGFNVIQTVALTEFMEGDEANYYKDSLFHAGNPLKPYITPGNDPADPVQYDYWDHLDYILQTAEKKGLYVGLLPTWGEWVIPRNGKALFNTPDETYAYGKFFGERYRNYPNIIWVLGGDRLPDEREGGVDLWRAMAEGIADGVNGEGKRDGKANYSTTFMTHHGYNSSSIWFHNDPWIDMHTWGSYHADVNNNRSLELALHDWNLPNPKPTLNSEPCYEGHSINYAIPDNGVFTSTDVRTAAYWSVFSGSAGFTYGAHAVWQFSDSARSPFNPLTFTNWQNSLHFPGAPQVILLKKFLESYPIKEMVPDPSMISAGQGNCSSYAPVLRGKSHAFIYIPTGNKTTVKMGMISGKTVTAFWFDPRTGVKTQIGTFDNKGEQSFDVPGMSKQLEWLRSGRGCDWVLVLEGKN